MSQLPFKMSELRRSGGVLTILLLACLSVGFAALQTGALHFTTAQVLDALAGRAAANVQMVVTQWRLPRVILALVIGGALGLSGAIFQSLLRNPLGSPDIIGFNTGAYTGVLLALVVFQNSMLAVTGAAIAGGMLTAMAVYLLSWRGGVETFRLLIIGIGIRAMLMAFNTWLILKASQESALSAGLWSAGSLNGLTWSGSVPVLWILGLAVLGCMGLARPMRLLEMGDDSACSLGIPVERTRLLLLLIGVVLTAAATALSGPVSFIALMAPQIARRLTGTQILALPTTALTGGLLLLAADFAAQHVFLPYQLPVGVLIVSIGGVYLIGLLFRESRRT